MDNRTCPTCNSVYEPHHAQQVYCTKQCRPRVDVKITLRCDACGGPAIKDKRKHRYEGTYCGTLCRDYAKYGATKCKIPPAHPARWYGLACEWVATLTRNTGECAWCGHANPRGRQAAYCTIQCAKKAKRQRRRAAEHNAPGEYRYSDVIKQYITQGRVCAYCDRPAGTLPEPDHVVALSRGGRNDMCNIVAACPACNADKRDLTLNEWRVDRERRKLPAVNTQPQGSRFPRLIIDTDLSNIRSLAA